MPSLALTKHHGAGNDFLVLLDEVGADLLGELARRLCHRRHGIGADGLVAARRGRDGVVRMVLHNADGGRAEMSGNGVRCLGQALVDAGWAPAGRVVVGTDAGDRALEVGPDDGSGRRLVRAGMGPARLLRLGEKEAEVDVGNPHLVRLVEDPSAVDLAELGRRHPDLNLEVARVEGSGEVTMRVNERGAGLTMACGTGSCAVVAATSAWGLTGHRVTVHNPGGDLEVELAGGECSLSGPVERVGRIEVQWP